MAPPPAPPPLVWVVVLGDFGRSPRMQYHAASLAAAGYGVAVVALPGSPPIAALRGAANVRLALLPPPPAALAAAPALLGLALKAAWQLAALAWLMLVALPRPVAILMQNPPAIPAMAACAAAAARHRAAWVVDWHNTAFSILALKHGRRRWLIALARWLERRGGAAGAAHFCVTAAMQRWLAAEFGVPAAVLYDRPPAAATSTPPMPPTRRPAAAAAAAAAARRRRRGGGGGGGESAARQQRQQQQRPERQQQPAATLLTLRPAPGAPPGPRPGRPALVVSSTSWTPDEDFGLLLDAALAYDAAAARAPAGTYPDVAFIITGRGPQRDAYLARVRRLRLARVAFASLWLEPEDYPALLGAADLGVCLHTSSSGLDLPMKVVDMFGAGLPVCAVDYPAITELVAPGRTGLLFTSAEQLARQLLELLAGFGGGAGGGGGKLAAMRAAVAEAHGAWRWDDNWARVAGPVFADAAAARGLCAAGAGAGGGGGGGREGVQKKAAGASVAGRAASPRQPRQRAAAARGGRAMPLILEEDSRAMSGFDPASAATLYWKDVPVLVRQADREDQTEALTFRILSGVTKQNHSLRVLRIHASSEADPYFLHTMEVTEDEFQGLKAEQGILVDFGSFPGKIVSLFERCIAAAAPDAPRFAAVLAVGAGESVLKIVETNDFKQLPHVTLAFRPGNDFTVKQFLAFRLGEVKDDCAKLQDQLANSQVESCQFQQRLAECTAQLADLQERHSRQTLELEAQLREQAATAQQDKLDAVAATRAQLERELDEAARRHAAQAELLNARIAELDGEGRKLRDQKYALDTQVSELSHKLGSAEGAARSLEQEVGQLRVQHKAVAADKHGLELALADTRAQLAAAQEKCSSQGQLIAQQQARLGDLEGAARQWEERCADLRDLAAGHEARCREAAGEVLKGNEAIDKLQTDLRLLKEKSKRKQAILVRQEEEIAGREAQLAAAQRELAAAGHAREGLAAEAGALKADNAELRAKLEESRQQLQSNEQMIRWLNQQVTDAQLQVSAVPGSRFKFRPSAAPAAGLGAATPGLTTSWPLAGAVTPGLAGGPGTAAKLGGAKAAHSTAPFAAFNAGKFSPQTVSPRHGDYALPTPRQDCAAPPPAPAASVATGVVRR
ncbi:hypothetical protein HT031_001995 [Scenedesmus sp. PABB004]|nr:hypothetical protein HT031_001995 [Scenedesmus sp. PABB004]